MLTILQISAFTRRDRGATLQALRDALAGAGAFITDATLFSNTAVALALELPAERLATLGAAIASCDVHLFEDAETALAAVVAAAKEPHAEAKVWLNVTFVHHEPDLPHEVPAVPG